MAEKTYLMGIQLSVLMVFISCDVSSLKQVKRERGEVGGKQNSEEQRKQTSHKSG